MIWNRAGQPARDRIGAIGRAFRGEENASTRMVTALATVDRMSTEVTGGLELVTTRERSRRKKAAGIGGRQCNCSRQEARGYYHYCWQCDELTHATI